MSQVRYTFDLLLEQDVIISQTSATAGQHQSLDYIPGATLLGLAASRLYSQITTEEAWTLFHSGHVRFCDALPVSISAQIGWPTPLSFHAYKGESTRHAEGGRWFLDACQLFNPARFEIDRSRQPKQQREGYVTEQGEHLTPIRTQRMKTAINPQTGRAAQGQLYGYESLQAGQPFRFSVIADSCVDNTLLERLKEILTGPARLGRSRSAQYGSVDIRPSSNNKALSQSKPTDKIQLWLLSDLALISNSGEATLEPAALALGLPQGSLWRPELSFIRSRSYSPYNAKRRCYDPQRQVLCRGSVLSFDLPEGSETSNLPAELWAGLYQEAGLGHIAVQPSLLGDARPVFTARGTAQQQAVSAPETPDSPLISLLELRVSSMRAGQEAERIARDIYQGLLDSLKQARRWKGIPQQQPLAAPSRSQWGEIKSLASDHRRAPETLWRSLFDADTGLLRSRAGQPGWDLELGPSKRLRDTFERAVAPYRNSPDLPEGIGRLAALALGGQWQQSVEGKTKEVSA